MELYDVFAPMIKEAGFVDTHVHELNGPLGHGRKIQCAKKLA